MGYARAYYSSRRRHLPGSCSTVPRAKAQVHCVGLSILKAFGHHFPQACVLVTFLVDMIKSLQEGRVCFDSLFKGAVHRCGETEQQGCKTPSLSSQEAEMKADVSFPFSFCSVQDLSPRMLLKSLERRGLSSSLNPIWKLPPRHTQKCVSY